MQLLTSYEQMLADNRERESKALAGRILARDFIEAATTLPEPDGDVEYGPHYVCAMDTLEADDYIDERGDDKYYRKLRDTNTTQVLAELRAPWGNDKLAVMSRRCDVEVHLSLGHPYMFDYLLLPMLNILFATRTSSDPMFVADARSGAIWYDVKGECEQCFKLPKDGEIFVNLQQMETMETPRDGERDFGMYAIAKLPTLVDGGKKLVFKRIIRRVA